MNRGHCLLGFHDDLFVTEPLVKDGPRVLHLKCQTCDRRTPGWHHEHLLPPVPSFLERLSRALDALNPFTVHEEGEGS